MVWITQGTLSQKHKALTQTSGPISSFLHLTEGALLPLLHFSKASTSCFTISLRIQYKRLSETVSVLLEYS